MKKWICGMLAAVFLLVGTACGNKPEKESAFPAELTTQALLDSGAFSESLEELETDIAAMMFWLPGDAAGYEGSKVYCSTGATAEIAAVICVADQSKLSEVEKALKSWVESQIEAERDYRPAEVSKLENAIIEVRGFTVLLTVAADWEKAEAVITEQ